MDAETAERFRRQAEWQKARKDRSFAEKLRIVEQIRESVIALRNAPLYDPDREQPRDHRQ